MIKIIGYAAREIGKTVVAFFVVATAFIAVIRWFQHVTEAMQTFCNTIAGATPQAIIVQRAHEQGYHVFVRRQQIIIDNPLLFGRATCTVKTENARSSHSDYRFED